MEKQYFKCYELFYKIGKDLPQDLKAKYYDALMEYGLYGTDPQDPIIKALMQGPMFSIDKSEEISETRSKQGKKHKGNQYMKGDTKRQAQKTPLEQNGTKVEQNGTGSNKKIIEDIEVIEDNRSNKKNNIIKNKYLDFVYLASDEYEKLLNQFGKKQTDELIDKLNNYIGSTGKRYKSHYFTILNRAKKEGGATTHSQAELMRERDRQRRLQEAQEVLNRSKNQDGDNIQHSTFDRRANLMSG